MLEDKIRNFTRKIAIPVVLGIGLAGYISGCDPDECEHDADCPEGEACGQTCKTVEHCSRNPDYNGYCTAPTEECHNVCYLSEK